MLQPLTSGKVLGLRSSARSPRHSGIKNQDVLVLLLCIKNWYDMLKTEKSLTDDLDDILGLYRSAIKYQKEKGYNLWPEFERSLIEKEISENRHYKITESGEIACVFSLLYNDPIIWKEKDAD